MGKETLNVKDPKSEYLPKSWTDLSDPHYDQIHRIYDLDLKVGRSTDYIYQVSLDELGPLWKNSDLYLNAVERLAKAGKVKEGPVIVSGKLAVLLNPAYAKRIPSAFENPVFQHYMEKDNLPTWSFGGREMLKALKRGKRKKNYNNELQVIRELGRQDVRSPDIVIGLGCGDGGKETERASSLLNAGKDIALVLVDYSQEAIDKSRQYATNVFSVILDQFPKDKRPRSFIFSIRDTFEHLPDNKAFQDILSRYPSRIFALYGSTAGNNYPSKSARELSNLMKPGDYAEVGIHLDDKDDNATLQLFGDNDAKAVTSRGLLSLGFEHEDIKSMLYDARIVKIYSQHQDFGILSVVQTGFIAMKPMLAGLIFLQKGELLTVTERYMYEDEQFRQVFTRGGFEVLNKRQIENDAIYRMIKQ